MTAEEISDCEKQVKSIQTKTDMERQNTSVIGNINDYAFLKTSVKEEQK